MKFLDIGYHVGPADKWGPFERRLVSIAVEAHLLAPSEKQRREKIRHVLLATRLEALVREAGSDERRIALAQAVKADVQAEVEAIASARSSTSYKNELRLDLDASKPGARYGTAMRPLLTAGLIMQTMYRSASDGVAIGPDKARDLINKGYETSAMFEAHEKGLKDAWTANRPVAHLAGALLQRIVDLKLRRFGGGARRQWRHEIAAYLEHAACFEQFLLGLKNRSRLLRFSVDDLVTIPGDLGIKATSPSNAFELPQEVRPKSLTSR